MLGKLLKPEILKQWVTTSGSMLNMRLAQAITIDPCTVYGKCD